MKLNQEKRLYTFTHSMLSPIAKGIQSLHSTVELFNSYTPNPGNNEEVRVNDDISKDAYSILFDWSLNHKTVISLNPGVSSDLEELNYLFQDPENFYPWAVFNEDSLKGLITSISIVLPEKIYNMAYYFKTGNFKFDYNFRRFQYNHKGNVTLEELQELATYGYYTDFEIELVQRLATYRLAN